MLNEYPALLEVKLCDLPRLTSKRKLSLFRERSLHRSYLLGIAAHGELRRYGDHREELVVVHRRFALLSDQQTAVLAALYLTVLQHVPQESEVVVLADVLKYSQGENVPGKFLRLNAPLRGQPAHRLVVQQAVRELREVHRLYPAFPGVEQYHSNAHHEIPVYFLVKLLRRQAHVPPERKAHFRDSAAAPCTPQALNKPGDGQRAAGLDDTFQLSKVDSEFQSDSGSGADRLLGGFHLLLGELPQSRGNIRVMNKVVIRKPALRGYSAEVRDVLLDLAL